MLQNKEELHVMEERIKMPVCCVVESNSKLSSSERKLILLCVICGLYCVICV